MILQIITIGMICKQTFKICTVEIFKAIIFAARNKICSEAIKVSKYFY